MSNVILLSKAQLKEGDTKTGIIVTSTPKKARFTRPYPVKFHISFMNGMNPYVGLQDFVSWEICGIQKGRMEKNKKGCLVSKVCKCSHNKWSKDPTQGIRKNRQVERGETFEQRIRWRQI
jgi:hypothetical protein